MLLDIVIVSDFRFPGGTSTAVAHEIRALSGAGYTIGLAQKRAALLKKDRDIHPQIAACLDAGQALLLRGNDLNHEIECGLAILHNPLVFTTLGSDLPSIRARHAILVADQPVTDAKGEPYYDVWAVQQTAAHLVGEVLWAPISPLLRENMHKARLPFATLESDWRYVFFPEDWNCDRSRPQRDRPVIGRHSRPEREKWPATRGDILTVYPDKPEFAVRLLGIGSEARAIVGEPLPSNWETYEFGELDPAEFLRSIDFFVYYHHPDWVEGFGRTIAEAAASGAVAILPPYLEATFGEAALYRAPADVLDTVRELYRNWNAYSIQSRTARRAIDRDYGPARLVQRVAKLIGKPDRNTGEAWKRAARRDKRTKQQRLPARTFDVVHLADMQTRGEAAWRIANLVGAEAASRYTSGLLNVRIERGRAATVHPLIDELVRTRSAVALDPSAPAISTKLLLVHDPAVLWASRKNLQPLPRIIAGRIVALTAAPSAARRIEKQDAFLQSFFGAAVSWAATSEKAHAALSEVETLRLEHDIWRPVVAETQSLPRERDHQPTAVIGCIGLDPSKDPNLATVRLARFAAKAKPPTTMRLLDPPVEPNTTDALSQAGCEFFFSDEISPRKFLSKLHFLAVLPVRGSQTLPEELIAWAMARGVVALLPAAFQSKIGEGPIYGKVRDIPRIASEIFADRRRLQRQSRRAAALARRKYAPSMHAARLRQLIGRPAKIFRAPVLHTAKKRVLFLSSNGVGLGHLTRLLAIARRMPATIEPVFATLSQAMPVVETAGYPVEYIPFHVYTNSDPEPWNRWLAEQLGQIARFHDTRVIVFDGSMPYYGVVRAVAPAETKAVWIRRAMWQAQQNMGDALERSRFFDLVIEPGDVAESLDRGASVGDDRAPVLKVPPISLLDAHDLHDRSSAAARLQIDPTRPSVLIQLGSGWNRDLASMLDTVLNAIAERSELQPVLVEWLISHRALDIWPHVPRLKGFPIAKYYNAFDFTISAAGYNSFNEIITFGLPAIFIANQHPMMDDQAARALYAVNNEAAFQLPETQLDGIGNLLDLMLDENVRAVMRMNCRRLARTNGASLAADAIAALVE